MIFDMMSSLYNMGLLLFVCVSSVILIFLFLKTIRKRNQVLACDHFMVTGGSRGIGLAVAVEAVLRGASVTIIARNKDQLQEAKKTLLSKVTTPNQKILSYSVDVSSDLETMKDIVKQAEEFNGPVTFLVNCAGTSVCYRFEETPADELETMLNVNVKGSVYITQALVPLMKQRRKGRIIFFSSIAGVIGIYGYTAYSASKFAIVGIAQSLKMELKPYGVGVTVSFPPDTDTPGFEKELQSKLLETKAISESAGIFSARDVAVKTLDDALNGHFASTVGLDGNVLLLLCGTSFPVTSFFGLLVQIFAMGPMRLFYAYFLWNADKKIKACLKMDKQSKQS